MAPYVPSCSIFPMVVSLSMLFVFFLLHVILFRYFQGLRKTLVLVVLSFIVLGIGVGLGPYIPLWRNLLPESFLEILLLLQFHLFMTLTYIICYSAIEQQSPSIMIIKKVHAAGDSGSSVESIEHLVDDTFLAEQRIEPLIRSGMTARSGENLILLSKGRVLSEIFHIFRVSTKNSKGA